MIARPRSSPRREILAAAAALALLAWESFDFPLAAAEAATAAFATDGATLRLVSERPGAGGRLRAALLVDLEPGWKTYWIDPGEAGVPPRIDLSHSRNVADVVLRYPAPRRFEDAGARSIGYSAPLAVGIELRQEAPGAPTQIRASVRLGLCKAICIPVAADLVLDPGAATTGDAGDVAAAFEAMPAGEDAGHGFLDAALSANDAVLTVSARAPAAEDERAMDLFVAGPKGWSFGPPTAIRRDGERVAFSLAVLARPRKPAAAPPRIDAVLTLGAAAWRADGLAVARRG